MKSPWEDLKGQIYLGDERFVGRMQRRLDQQADDINIPLVQRRAPPQPLADIARTCKDRDEAILKAHKTGHYSYSEIGDHFKVHFTTVGRIVRTGRARKK